jgi:hypothetical protein
MKNRLGLAAMTTLLVGFDSAWTPTNSGALIGVLRADDGTLLELGSPRIVNYSEAEGRSAQRRSQLRHPHRPAFHVAGKTTLL